jgi:hypothetical protein
MVYLIAIVLLLAVVWWQSRPTTPPPPAPRATVSEPSPTVQTQSATPASPLTYQAPVKGKYQGTTDPRWEWWKQMERRDPKFEWKMPIKFYGKVVDQDGQPISGVRIRYGWNDISGSNERFDQSDAQGMFSIENIQGKLLSVRLERQGYHAVNNGFRSFEYAAFFEPDYHEPDPKNPVVFQMLKKGPSEPMIHCGPTLLGARNDGTSTSFDLITGRRAAADSGDIAVRITKGPKTSNRFDWTATVEGKGGTGLIESNDEFMVTAPADGYQPRWTFGQKATDREYQAQVQTKFYVKTGDGKYARIEMRIIPEYNKTAAVDLTVYLNPTPGSRNLEFDPKEIVESP